MPTATKPQPRPGATRVCPGCARRDTMLVDPQCPICDGLGVLFLAPMKEFHDDVISEAVELALESAAREVVTRVPAAVLTGVAAQALRDRVAALRDIKVLATRPSPRTEPVTGRTHPDAAQRIARWSGANPTPEDQRVLTTPPVEWLRTRRPLAHGGIPGFSMGGFICALARTVDPVDPLSQPALGFGPGRRKRSDDAHQLALLAVQEFEKKQHARGSA